MISELVKEKILEGRHPIPTYSHWVSRVTHPCARYLYHARVDWDKALGPDPGLQEVFTEGRLQEEATLGLLRKAGFRIIEEQRPFSWDELEISGRIDGRLLPPDPPPPGWPSKNGRPHAVPFEIKSLSPYAFERFSSEADFYTAPLHQYYYRAFPLQLQMYLLLAGEPLGVLLLKNKHRAELKEIFVQLDIDALDQIILRIDDVNARIRARTPPPQVTGPWCEDCPWRDICLPPLIEEGGAELLDDAELEALLLRLLDLKEKARELEEVEAEVRARLGERERVVVGDILVEGRWVERRGYSVGPSRTLVRKYIRLGQKGVETGKSARGEASQRGSPT